MGNTRVRFKIPFLNLKSNKNNYFIILADLIYYNYNIIYIRRCNQIALKLGVSQIQYVPNHENFGSGSYL